MVHNCGGNQEICQGWYIYWLRKNDCKSSSYGLMIYMYLPCIGYTLEYLCVHCTSFKYEVSIIVKLLPLKFHQNTPTLEMLENMWLESKSSVRCMVWFLLDKNILSSQTWIPC